ncbi:MAG: helix-turn-helix domain-containing protein [Clostridiales bacterium]|nr:helix-turn-helix domain-containing protein [Clostridiales bacterium]
MENLGQTITDYRKKLNLTQKDLGEKLNVSPQAVSKWENGQAEPDASTIKKLCEIFKISTDELLGNTPPESEIAATAAQVPEPVQPAAPAPQPQIVRETVVEQKIINGYCEKCKKPVGPDEYVVTHSGRGTGTQHIYCNKCKAEMDAAHRHAEYYNHKRATVKSVIWGAVGGVIALVAVLVAFLVGVPDFPKAAAVIISVIAGVAFFSFVMQMFWDGVVNDMFFFFLKSFKMPGVIFTLDLDGIIFLLLVKIGGAILGAILSVIFFLIGMIITPLGSILILPFASIARAVEAKKLKTAAEK